MGWLNRMLGKDKDSNVDIENASVAPVPSDQSIIPERLGLNGEYDQSGLAKRVALAFDQDDELDDEERLWVAQTSSKVVLKGTVSSQDILDKMIEVALAVKGASSVDTEQVTIE